ncbi:Bromo adjacent homology (BAH) domain [Macleaya cordata]|uniref:Bromo adjacent homology (BAH) domain n=1 Tax=Macleaya cordata TaxID=56857 RepID=A0A200RBV2_MACCD|nr:Bromo adjacent homology (BAH) domain [Macleaya cordata]
MSMEDHGFLEWKEEFVSQERGNRVVHYYLKDTAGESILAVVGTERSLRHMVYVVEEKFLQVHGPEVSISAGFKWRSRREVVDWLTSLLSKQHPPRDCLKSPSNDSTQAIGSSNLSMKGLNAPESYEPDRMGRFSRELKGHNSDILWSGDSWTCGKQLKHYPTFCRSGTIIAIHAFVLIMAKEETHYLAYLEDMYEDRKGQKKVKVRWFHYNQEVEAVIRVSKPHPREVFITPHSQVISAECVDGPATVLTPEHYEKCLAILPHTSSERVYLCFRQFKSNKVKPFDLSKLRGYFEQAILSCLEEEEELVKGKGIKMGSKKIRSSRGQQRTLTNSSGGKVSGQSSAMTSSGPANQNLKLGLSDSRPLTVNSVGIQPSISLPFKVKDKIELLSNDSGIRGCWFRCKILQASQKQLKVQYDDLQDVDGPGNLKEWVPAFRLAPPDKLGMRCSDRPRIRPCPPEDLTVVFEIGAPVDAWWNDGWWEGVLVGNKNCGDGGLKVYFPGENRFLNIQKKNLRRSRDWDGNQWIDIKTNPDILSTIAAVLRAGTKLSANSAIAKVAESGGSAMSDRKVPNTSKLDTVKESKQDLDGSAGSNVIPENVTWVNLRKPTVTDDKGKRVDGHDDYENKVDGEMDKMDMKEDNMEIDHKDKRGDGMDGDGHNVKEDENKDDCEKDKVNMKEDIIETAGQKCEAVEFMEVGGEDV